MFSLLNNKRQSGKSPAWMCKILDSLSPFFRAISLRFWQWRYLVESGQFRNEDSAYVGLRIALLIRQPAVLHIRSRKD